MAASTNTQAGLLLAIDLYYVETLLLPCCPAYRCALCVLQHATMLESYPKNISETTHYNKLCRLRTSNLKIVSNSPITALLILLD